jgi:hypothetical protein
MLAVAGHGHERRGRPVLVLDDAAPLGPQPGPVLAQGGLGIAPNTGASGVSEEVQGVTEALFEC